jgi:3-hydroxyisobutyrate dehydrogenase-like beta-hydroxyacid dehydrogenase
MERAELVFVGYGEAAQAFVEGMALPFGAYDRKTQGEATRTLKQAEYARTGAIGFASNAEAVAAAPLILSLVTADQALAAARESAAAIPPGALYCDMNSVAPDTKREAARLIEAAGGRYVDVAVMAPVHPARRAVPLLVSGPHAEAAVEALWGAGFLKLRILPGGIGAASATKMLRSVMVKGLEALTAECVLAATRAGLRDEVFSALNASWPGTDWLEKADYNLERMMVHGLRRAEEMEEVVKTLDSLGTGSAMTRGTVERQRAIGRLGLGGEGSIDAKIAAIVGEGQGASMQDEAA